MTLPNTPRETYKDGDAGAPHFSQSSVLQSGDADCKKE